MKVKSHMHVHTYVHTIDHSHKGHYLQLKCNGQTFTLSTMNTLN